MASQSSRPKSGLSGLHDEVVRLLRDGAVVPAPSDGLITATKQLRKLGLIEVTTREYVRCADPQDPDFPPKTRNCEGRIYLHDGMDEPGHDYRCPDCDRPVFPDRHRKRKHGEIHVKVLPDGVTGLVSKKLATLKKDMKPLGDGVLRIDVGDIGVIVCVVDYCNEDKYMTRDWACSHPTCYIAVNRKALEERFLNENWLVRLCLADIVCGNVDLAESVKELGAGKSPGTFVNASVPVYTKGPVPVVIEPVEPAHADRRFVVEVGGNLVRVEGETVVAPQAGTRFLVFTILWERFLEDLREGRAPDDFRPIRLDDIIKAFQERTEKYVEDATTIRRAINRLQTDIETAVKKKSGLPIDREDVLQTCKWKGIAGGDYGYRLNPSTVAARPFQPTKG